MHGASGMIQCWTASPRVTERSGLADVAFGYVDATLLRFPRVIARSVSIGAFGTRPAVNNPFVSCSVSVSWV